MLISFSFISMLISELVRLSRGDPASWRTTLIISDIPFILCIILIIIFNYLFYYVLKKKYNFEANVFFYGIGFTSCCVISIIFIQALLDNPYGKGIDVLLWSILYMLSFVLVYYSYAILCQNEKKDHKFVLRLSIFVFIYSLILSVVEIAYFRPPVAGILLLLLGLYLFFCLLFEKIRLSVRGFAWVLFVPMFIVNLYGFLTTPFM
ncbi:hypothetical protein MsAc7_06430 [Methanolapillus millepedarum]|uniref:Uncharacterized protein n=2 Tax=Methanolapillus millepedarum TaxID=3028296 RepID=A0AA96ZVQ3_9EURY|nr:hypothetical protein MsAc7_06430 [Methanosarcinaceae archaeon Ac7]